MSLRATPPPNPVNKDATFHASILEKRQTSRSFISQLPNELLLAVFVEVQRGSDLKEWHHITHVCKAWRALATGAPTLWTHLKPTEGNHPYMLLHIMRSATMSLDISIHDTILAVTLFAILSQMGRVRSLSFQYPAPRDHALIIQGFLLCTTLILTQVRNVVSLDWDAFLEILTRMSCLESFCVNIYELQLKKPDEPIRPVTLQQQRKVTFLECDLQQIACLTSYISAPNLHDLSVSWYEDRHAEDIAHDDLPETMKGFATLIQQGSFGAFKDVRLTHTGHILAIEFGSPRRSFVLGISADMPSDFEAHNVKEFLNGIPSLNQAEIVEVVHWVRESFVETADLVTTFGHLPCLKSIVAIDHYAETVIQSLQPFLPHSPTDTAASVPFPQLHSLSLLDPYTYKQGSRWCGHTAQMWDSQDESEPALEDKLRGCVDLLSYLIGCFPAVLVVPFTELWSGSGAFEYSDLFPRAFTFDSGAFPLVSLVCDSPREHCLSWCPDGCEHDAQCRNAR